ncbi:amino acid adenylation domain-containing protein, partial [Nocardia sp. NPDC056000]|uniref:amino acid adenylation domain-containing protein n=1 Tax=Nocardia sp. NPDC056000 TaxID=3345674 RepID=UPI0035DD2921
SGAGYVPIDPSYPVERVGFMLADAEPAAVITDTATAAEFAVAQADTPGTRAAGWLSVDAPELAALPDGPVHRTAPPRDSDTAYVIYTSGSTGVPKGVVVSHGALSNFLAHMRSTLELGARDVWFAVTTVSFDIAALELFLPLVCGARVQIASDAAVRDAVLLAGELRTAGATVMQATPSLWGSLEVVDPAVVAGLRVLVGGEALPVGLGNWLAEQAGSVLNLYGPTEVTVWCTQSPVAVDRSGPVPIGRPFFNSRAYVLDADLGLTPPGVVGELYMGGAQLARGYLRRAALTASRFVANPFGTGDRLYRTGDLVRWNASGELEYVGRGDDQVKLRGFRIELGEVETALNGLPGVAQAAAVVRSEPGGARHLVGYVVAQPDTSMDGAVLRSLLGAGLPGHLVPAVVVLLERFPLTPNGKVDRRALPAPDFAALVSARAPRTPREELLCELFAEVLGLEQVGADDSFFTLGGDSIISIQLVARARTRGLALTARQVFEQQTVAGLAAVATTVTGDGALLASDAELVRPDPADLAVWRQRYPDLADLWTLSPLQAGFLFHTELSGSTLDAYHMQFVLSLRGTLDANRLRGAAATLLRRYPNLRAAFTTDAAGAPVQIIVRDVPLEWSEHTAAEADSVPGLLAADFARPFDPATPPLIRFALIDTGADEWKFAVTYHHVLLDGWSMPVLLSELLELYRTEGDPTGLAPIRSYREFLLWLADRDDSVAAAAWARALEDCAEPTLLAGPRGARASDTAMAEHWHEFDEQATRALSRAAATAGVTVNTVLQAAWAVVLSGLTGRTDVVFGATVSGRPPQLPGVEAMVGLFINTVPVRVRLRASDTFTDLARRLQQEQAVLLEHHQHGLADIQAAAGLGDLFDTLLVYESFPVVSADLDAVSGAGLAVTDIAATDSAHYPFGILAIPGDRLRLRFGYLTTMFDAEQAEGIASRMLRTLAAVGADTGIRLPEIGLLDDAERIASAGVADSVPVPVRTLAQLLDAAVAANPYGTALRFENRSVSYTELDRRANHIARELIRHGVGPEDLVAVAIERSVESVTAVWAVARTGAAFVPVDPRYPADRVAYMIEDSGVAVGLTMSAVRSGLPGTVRWLALDELAEVRTEDGPITDADRIRPLLPAHPAYMIYTSGSTGRPKGVLVTHAGLANFSAAQLERYAPERDSRVLHASSPSFDAAVSELLLAVGSAATFVIASRNSYGGAELAQLLAAERVTHIVLTPQVLASFEPTGLDSLRVVVSVGENCPPELVAIWAGTDTAGAREFFNDYGPTESTIWATGAGPLTAAAGPVSIGTPIPGVRCLVLDAWLRPVLPGVVGELYLGGSQLARGYHGQAALTAARFVADPFGGTGQRLYRTGDLVRRCVNGELEFAGRVDDQVKIRGFRIELGEVETALAGGADVAQAVVAVREDSGGAMQLVGYVVPAVGAVLDPAVLRAEVGAALPEHMVPLVVVLERLPLTPNGKLDRAALPAPELSAPASFRGPRDAREEVLCGLFAEVLGVDQVGIDDSFFDLGGHSLLGARLLTRVRSVLGVALTVRDLFDAPTVALLIERVNTAATVERPALKRMR